MGYNSSPSRELLSDPGKVIFDSSLINSPNVQREDTKWNAPISKEFWGLELWKQTRTLSQIQSAW